MGILVDFGTVRFVGKSQEIVEAYWVELDPSFKLKLDYHHTSSEAPRTQLHWDSIFGRTRWAVDARWGLMAAPEGLTSWLGLTGDTGPVERSFGSFSPFKYVNPPAVSAQE